MSVDLETLALIAAAVCKPLRASLDANDFHPSQRVLIESLNDGKTRESRDVVTRWLRSLGVEWDGKSEIGAAIVASLAEREKRRRAQSKLERALMRLRYPMIAGSGGVDDAVKLAAILEGVKSELGESDRQRDS